MEVFVCVKRFLPDVNYSDEIVGVFNDRKTSEEFAKLIPRVSMDDPNLFKVEIKKFEMNKTSRSY